MVRTFADALLDAVRSLNASGVSYAISGSVAKALYGTPPTMTKDLDVLAERLPPIEARLRPQFSAIASDAFEDVSGFVVELFEARLPLEIEMLARAKEHRLGPERVMVLDPTDWAAVKLEEAKDVPIERLKHIADVQAVARVQPFDCRRLTALVSTFGAQRELRDADVCPAAPR